MSLVAYDSSDGSDEESETETGSSGPTQRTLSPDLSTPILLLDSEVKAEVGEVQTNSAKGGLFSLLPAPKCPTALALIPEDPVPRNILKKEPVKIMIPSLKEFEEDEDEDGEKHVKRKPSKVGSGLLGLLPDPQNLTIKETAKQLVPLSVSRKSTANPPVKAAPKLAPPSAIIINSRTVSENPKETDTIEKSQDGNSSDEEPPADFFSLSANQESTVPELQMETESTVVSNGSDGSQETKMDAYGGYDASSLSTDCGSSGSGGFQSAAYSNVSYGSSTSLGYEDAYPQDQNYETPTSQEFEWDDQSTSSDVSTLKNEALVRLAGKKRGAQESIEFVDVKEDDLVAGREEWLLKSLSETNSYQPAPKRSDQPSAVHRRKHQITYLAFQAKAREQELKNQWSMNRMTKKQTQSKYGF